MNRWRPPPPDLCPACQTAWRTWRQYRHFDRGVNAWRESSRAAMVLPDDRDAETIVSQQDVIAAVCRANHQG